MVFNVTGLVALDLSSNRDGAVAFVCVRWRQRRRVVEHAAILIVVHDECGLGKHLWMIHQSLDKLRCNVLAVWRYIRRMLR